MCVFKPFSTVFVISDREILIKLSFILLVLMKVDFIDELKKFSHALLQMHSFLCHVLLETNVCNQSSISSAAENNGGRRLLGSGSTCELVTPQCEP